MNKEDNTNISIDNSHITHSTDNKRRRIEEALDDNTSSSFQEFSSKLMKLTSLASFTSELTPTELNNSESTLLPGLFNDAAMLEQFGLKEKYKRQQELQTQERRQYIALAQTRLQQQVLQQQQMKEKKEVEEVVPNICIGMITTDIVTVHALNIVKEDKYEVVRLESEGRRNTDNYSFTVTSRNVPSRFYGWVPFETTKVLGPLVDDYLIWWDAVIPRAKINHTRIPIYIILYCRPDYYSVVTNHMHYKYIQLKEPPFHNPHCRYSNPHQYIQDYQSDYTPRYYPHDVNQQTRLDIEQLLDSIPNDIPKRRKRSKYTVKQDQTQEVIEIDDDEQSEDEDGHIEGLTISLMPHQIQGVNWMIDRENNDSSSGGILADDMGLGKTIQTIALVASTMSTEEPRITLIITPLALIHQWADEIRTKTEKGKIKVMVHHGPNRTKNPKAFLKYDVVITTYQVVASDMPNVKKDKGKTLLNAFKSSRYDDVIDDNESTSSSTSSPAEEDNKRKDHGPLFQVDWYRVVLDEAQQIKNRNTRSSLSCSALTAVKRWCLTGTPIQNNVDELYSLMRFLQIMPLSNYPSFKKTISIPIQQGNAKLAMERLKAVLMAIMLRRTKAILNKPVEENEKKMSVKLPTREKEDIVLTFSRYERTLYDLLKRKANDSVKIIMESSKKQNGYLNMLCLLLRLRQACDHPQLVLNQLEEDKDAMDLLEDSNQSSAEMLREEDRVCRLCGKKREQRSLCDDCYSKVGETITETSNPAHSTKINKLMEILNETREHHPSQKTIVFSQFTSMLDLMEGPLKAHKFKFCRYDGSMSTQSRERSLTSLRYDPKCTVMLISLKCGSLGLNLTAANRVILMDIWWNPALEEQAIDRVHRIGQRLPVYVTRLMIDKTVEESILALQDKKAALTKGALGDGMVKSTKLSSSEIRSLFFS